MEEEEESVPMAYCLSLSYQVLKMLIFEITAMTPITAMRAKMLH